MHINNWVQASDLMKMIKSANGTSTLSSEEGLPDNHVITIRERELTVDFPELIQNNIKTDTVTLDLDKEWDGIQPVIIFGPNASGTIAVEYTGEPVHIPGAVMQYVGGLDCSVMGLDDSGEVRLVTKAAPNTFEVVESGEYIGQISEDDVSLLGRILSAIKDVETATSDASSAAEAATAAANSANTAATKATDAANSANTATTKANDAANSANTASERAENAYDALTPIIAEIGVNGNQPRATTNPNHIATASDAYAAKPLEICIKGATRQNLWSQHRDMAYTIKGITYTPNADGSETISGEGNGFTDLYGGQFYILRPDSTYTVSVNASPGTRNYIGVRINGGFSGFACTGNETSHTFTTPSSISTVEFGFYGRSLKAGTYRVMLNEGSTAQPWCPPGLNSVDELSVVTAGKNLLPTGEFHGIGWGIDRQDVVAVLNTLPVGTYKLSGIFKLISSTSSSSTYGYVVGTSQLGYIISSRYRWNSTVAGTVGKAEDTLTITDAIKGDFNHFYIYGCGLEESGPTGTADINLQLELGSTTTPIDLDGNTLCSLPDGTCDELTIDATGAVTLTQRVGSVEVPNGAELIANNEEDTYRFDTVISSAAGTMDYENSYCDKAAADGSRPTAVISCLKSIRKDVVSFFCPTSSFASSELAESAVKSILPVKLVYPLATPQTIPLTAVTLPTLPSPNITVYHDSDVPSDITVEYVQDINIVLDNLNAKIAALNIAQSISS